MVDIEQALDEVHPGDVLYEEFMLPLNISTAELADSIGVPVAVVADLVGRRLAVSVELAERLASRFGSTPAFWTNLQSEYDIRTTQGER